MSGYQGWKNYETWATALWLDNEQGTYRLTRQLARDAKADARAHPNVPRIWTREEAARFNLAAWLKEYVEEQAPDLGGTLYGDLMNAAISEIDFDEIARNYLEELADDEDDEAEAEVEA